MTKRSIFFPHFGRGRIVVTGLYLGGPGLATIAVVWLGYASLTAAARYTAAAIFDSKPTEAAGGFTRQSLVLEDDEWMAGVKRMFRSNGSSSNSNSYSSSGSSRRESRRSRAQRSYDAPSRVGLFDTSSSDEPRSRRGGRSRSSRSDTGTYRTVCVRLCDGFSFPISFSTTRGNFARDQRICERSCSAPAKLYTFPGGETDPIEMHDIDGRPYSELPNAYRFQTVYDESCKCKPNPWEAASQERHRIYGLQEKSRKGDATARNELKELHAAGTITDEDIAASEVKKQSSRSRRASRYR